MRVYSRVLSREPANDRGVYVMLVLRRLGGAMTRGLAAMQGR